MTTGEVDAALAKGFERRQSLAKLVGWGTTAVLIVGGALFGWLAWLQSHQPAAWHDRAGWWAWLSHVDGSALFDAARTTATILAVIGVGGAALVAYRRQATTELTYEFTVRAHEVAIESQNTAAEQLQLDSQKYELDRQRHQLDVERRNDDRQRELEKSWRETRLETYNDFLRAHRQYIAYVLEKEAKIEARPHPGPDVPDQKMPFFDDKGRPVRERHEAAFSAVRLVASEQSTEQAMVNLVTSARQVACARAEYLPEDIPSHLFRKMSVDEQAFINAARRELGLGAQERGY